MNDYTMKTIIILLISLLFLINNIYSQTPTAGTYVTNNTMVAFHGTWEWVNGIDTVKIYLVTKKVHIAEDNYDIDLLVGWHMYKKGNVIVESSYSNINNLNLRTITLWDDGTPYSQKLQGTIDDLTKAPKHNMVNLTINTSQNQITWRSSESAGRIYTSSQSVPPSGITLPQNMVLTKQ